MRVRNVEKVKKGADCSNMAMRSTWGKVKSPGDFCSMDFHGPRVALGGPEFRVPCAFWTGSRAGTCGAELRNLRGENSGLLFGVWGGDLKRPEFVAAKPSLGGGWRG